MVSVSVILPVLNGESMLKDSVLSILNQTFRDFELIIIDDGSTDSSYALAKQLSEKDKRIRVFKNRKNLGIGKSLSSGISRARGKYIARADVDDLSLPRRLEKQHDFLERNRQIYLLGTNSYIAYGKKRYLRGTITGAEKNRRKLPTMNHMVHSSIMFRNDKEVDYRHKFRYSQDYDLYLNVLSKGLQIDNLPEPLVVYRVGENMWSANKSVQARFAALARKYYYQRIRTGRDDYAKLDVSKITGRNKKYRYSSLEYIIDLLIYSDKSSAIRLMLENRNRLSAGFILKKAMLLISPRSLMDLQHRIRNRFEVKI